VNCGFSHLKDLLELCPVYHQSDARVEAHVFVAALALLLDRALEKSLQAGGSLLSTPFVWQALEMIRCVEVDLGQCRNVLLDPRQPARCRNAAGSGNHAAGSAFTSGGSRMTHVVTKVKNPSFGFKGL